MILQSTKKQTCFFWHPDVIMGHSKQLTPIFYEELATSTRIGRGFSRPLNPWVWGLVVAPFFFWGRETENPSTTSRYTGPNQTFQKACLERFHFLQFLVLGSKVWWKEFFKQEDEIFGKQKFRLYPSGSS